MGINPNGVPPKACRKAIAEVLATDQSEEHEVPRYQEQNAGSTNV
jgi:hypothetical protein